MKKEVEGTIRCHDCGRKFGDHFEGKLTVKCYNCNTYSVFNTDEPDQRYALENGLTIVGKFAIT